MTTSNITQQKYTVTVNEGDTTVVTVKAVGPQGADGTLAAGDIGDLTVSVAGNGAQSAVINSGAVTSDKILDGTIVNADINASAAIDGSKINPLFTSDISITEGNPTINFIDDNARDYLIRVDSGTWTVRDITDNNSARIQIASDGIVDIFKRLDARQGIAVTGDISCSGTVDGRDVATDGLKLDGIESNATADQTASEILSLLSDQNITTTGTIASGDITISDVNPKLTFTDTNNNPDYTLIANNGQFLIRDDTNNEIRLRVNTDGHVDVTGNLDLAGNLDITDGTLIIDNDANSPNTSFGLAEALRIDDSGLTQDRGLSIYEYHQSGARFFSLNYNLESTSNGSAYVYTQGLYSGSTMLQIGANDYRFFVDAQVSSGSRDAITPTERFRINTAGVNITGNITLSGKVDNVDIATRDTLFGALTSSSGVLTNGVTATTQSAGDNSTKVATTAYTDTAISNLVDSSPSTLNTLNELAAALGDDANFSTTVTNSIATKLPLAGGTLTGTLTINNAAPNLLFTESDANPDFGILLSAGQLKFQDVTNTANILTLDDDKIQAVKNLDALAGVDVTGDITGTGDLTLTSTVPTINFVDTDNNSDFSVKNENGVFKIVDTTNSTTRFQIISSGITNIEAPLNVNGNFITSGTATVNGGNLTISGTAPFLRLNDTDNNPDYKLFNIGGVFQIFDDTNSAVRLKISTSGNIQIPADDKKFQIGASNDLELFHDSNDSIINDAGTGNLKLQLGGSTKLEITSAGATLTGAVTATAINVCHLKSDTTASVTSTAAVINFNQESTTDTNKFSHSGGEITVLTTGWYAVKANVTYQSAASSRRNTIKTEIQKNGTSITSAEKYTFIQSDIKPIATAFVNGSGSVNKQNGGFSSVTRTAEGRYTLTFTNAMADDDYQVFGQIVEGGNRDDIKIHVKDLQQTTSDFKVEIYEGDNSSTADTYRDRKFYVQVLDTNTAWGRYGQASIDTFVYLTANDIIRIRTQQIDEEGTTTILGASSEFFVKAVI